MSKYYILPLVFIITSQEMALCRMRDRYDSVSGSSSHAEGISEEARVSAKVCSIFIHLIQFCC